MKMCIKCTLRVKGYVAQLRVIGIMIIWTFLSKINCPKFDQNLKIFNTKKSWGRARFSAGLKAQLQKEKNFFPKNWAGWAGLWFSLPARPGPGRAGHISIPAFTKEKVKWTGHFHCPRKIRLLIVIFQRLSISDCRITWPLYIWFNRYLFNQRAPNLLPRFMSFVSFLFKIKQEAWKLSEPY